MDSLLTLVNDMTNKARFRVDGNGSSALPITGGTDTFTADNLEEGYERLYFTIVFYTDNTLTVKATPTTGTVTFTGLDDDAELSIDNGSFSAANVYLNSTVQPAGAGNFTGARLTLDGVDAGLYAKAWVWQKGCDDAR